MNAMRNCGRWAVRLAVAAVVALAAGSADGWAAEGHGQGEGRGDGQEKLRLDPLIGDDMILQRDLPAAVWGWAAPGGEVTVAFAGQNVSATAGEDGWWRVKLAPMKASAEGRKMTIAVGGEAVTVSNVVVGDVWVCSGQSNMQWEMERDAAAETELPTAGEGELRLFQMGNPASPRPMRKSVGGRWDECDPNTVLRFSAVGYYFGKHIHNELGVPIGLIDATWGGTRILPWTPGRDPNRLAADAKVSESTPTALYNGRIHPLTATAVRGVLWYQGESDVIAHDRMYLKKMRDLVRLWRAAWGRDDMPFYYVQLAPFRYAMWFKRHPDPDALPLVWEAQLQALSIARTGMAVVTDLVDDVNKIHPRAKAEVGRRLALWALADEYGREGLVHSGPLYESLEIDGAEAIVRFAHVGGGLKSRDGKPLTHWEIAGADGAWRKAEAKIVGETVVVTGPQVDKPAAVRFAWSETAEPNLTNAEGLPASPFRAIAKK